MGRRERIKCLQSQAPELTTAEYQELDSLKDEELRDLWGFLSDVVANHRCGDPDYCPVCVAKRKYEANQ